MKLPNFFKNNHKANNNSNDENIESPFSNIQYFASIKIDKGHREELNSLIDINNYTQSMPFFTLDNAQKYISDLALKSVDVPNAKLLISFFENNNGVGNLIYDFKYQLDPTFDDLLKITFSDIFNNEDNRTTSYNQLSSFATELRSSYIEQTNKQDKLVVQVPNENEASINPTVIKAPIELDNKNPNLSGGNYPKKDNNNPNLSGGNYPKKGNNNPNLSGGNYPKKDNNNPNLSSGGYPKKDNNNPNLSSGGYPKKGNNNPSRKKIYEKDNDRLYNPDYIKDRLDVINQIALFTTSKDLPEAVDPKDPSYVKVSDNSNKREFNDRIKTMMTVTQNKISNPLIEKANNYESEIEKEFNDWINKNKPNDSIYTNIKQRIDEQIDSKLKNSKQVTEQQRKDELTNAEKDYKLKVNQINTRYDNQNNQNEEKIRNTFNNKFTEAKKNIYDEANKKFEEEKDQIYKKLVSKKQNLLEKDINDARQKLLDTADELIKSAQSDVKNSHDKLLEEYYHAVQVDNERKNTEESNRRKMKQEQDSQNTNQIAKQAIESNKEIVEEIKKIAQQNNNNEPRNSELDNLIKLVVLRETKNLNKTENEDSSKNNEPVIDSATQQKLDKIDELINSNKQFQETIHKQSEEINNVKTLNNQNIKGRKKNKLISSILVCVIILGGALGGYGYYHAVSGNSKQSQVTTSKQEPKVQSQSNKTTGNANKNKVSNFTELVQSKKYFEAASKYPNKLNDIENNIYENNNSKELQQFNKVYDTEFGKLDYVLLSSNNLYEINSTFNSLNTYNLKTNKRTKAVSLALLKLNRIDTVKKINAVRPTVTVSNAIAKY